MVGGSQTPLVPLLVSCQSRASGPEYLFAHLGLIRWTLEQLTKTRLIELIPGEEGVITHYYLTSELDRLKELFHLTGIVGGMAWPRSRLDELWVVYQVVLEGD